MRSAFPDGGTIPRIYTCDGTRRPPALSWTGVPARARELVLVVEDPDAPGGTYVHWTAFGIPPSASTVPAHVAAGKSSAGGEGWTPPCPPQGDRPHRYVFTVYALDRRSGLLAGAGAGAVRSAIASSAIARGRLMARYGR